MNSLKKSKSNLLTFSYPIPQLMRSQVSFRGCTRQLEPVLHCEDKKVDILVFCEQCITRLKT